MPSATRCSVVLFCLALGCTSTKVNDGASSESIAPKSCPNGYALCDGLCVNPKSDTLNCGACSKTCGAGEICVDRGCKSFPALANSDPDCVDVAAVYWTLAAAVAAIGSGVEAVCVTNVQTVAADLTVP